MVKQIIQVYREKPSTNMTKYLDPPSVGTGAGPKISECIRSKGAEEKESLLLEGNFVCLPKLQEVQPNF